METYADYLFSLSLNGFEKEIKDFTREQCHDLHSYLLRNNAPKSYLYRLLKIMVNKIPPTVYPKGNHRIEAPKNYSFNFEQSRYRLASDDHHYVNS